MSGINQSFTTNSVSATSPEDIYLGFKPKVVFAMGAGLNSFSTSYSLQGSCGFGWTTDPATGQPATSVGSGGYTSVANFGGNVISESVWVQIGGNTNVHGYGLDIMDFNCEPAPFTNSGFTWQKGPGQFPEIIPLIALGGNNISAYAGNFAWPSAAGDVVVTGVGFEPQLVIFLWGKVDTYNFSPFPITNNAGIAFGMGAASSADTSEQFAFYGGGNNWFGDHYGRSAHWTGNCVGNVTQSGMGDTAFLASMDSDGFTVTFSGPGDTEIASMPNRLIGYICLRDDGGGGFHVGNGTAKTSNGTQAYTGCPFTPDQVIIGHGDVATANTWYDQAGSQGLGMFDDTLQASIVSGEYNYPGIQSGRRLNNTAIAYGYDGSDLAEADRVSIDSGGFTLDWTLTDGTAYPFGWIAMKTTGGNSPCGPSGFIPQIYRWLKR